MIISFIVVPLWGIEGAALATTLSTSFIMISCLLYTFRVSKVPLAIKDFIKILAASLIMGIVCLVIPPNFLGLIAALFIGIIVYVGSLIFLKGLKKDDLKLAYKIADKTGPLRPKINNIIAKLSKYTQD